MDNRAVSPVVGVILMVAITVVLSVGVYLVAQNNVNEVGESQYIGFDRNDDELTIISTSDPLMVWEKVAVDGCDAHAYTGTITPGQTLTGCSGAVMVVYNDSVLYQVTI